MRRADRLYRVLAFLRRRRAATARELAQHLEVSERTIYRDVRDLQDNGVPIRGAAGVGYRLERGAQLAPLMLDTEELQALVFGARMVQRWGDPELRAAARSALDKLAAVLPEGQKDWLDQTPLFTFPSHIDPTTAQKLRTSREAISARRVLEFAYTDSKGAKSQRCVHPLGLWFWTERWTLAAWCELRGDYRSFRLDRLESLSQSERSFKEHSGSTVQAFLANLYAREGVQVGHR